MIANVHALGVSAMAAFGPQILGDTLTLVDGEEDEEPPPARLEGARPLCARHAHIRLTRPRAGRLGEN